MVYRDRIQIDPKICGGKPAIRGTRILVTSIPSQLAAGESSKEIRQGFPRLSDKNVHSAIEYAEGSVQATELSALGD